MHILVMGGTRFVGRLLVEVALDRGHQVTLFHRGATGSDLFPQVTHLLGDRAGDLSALANGQWDVVVDTCGYVPGIVARTTALLKDRVARYVFVSSISVYAEFPPLGDEDDPVAVLPDPTVTAITGETYGGLKALCEDEVRRAFPEAHQIVRAGMIIGPHDYTYRFRYWLDRLQEGGQVLVPGHLEQPLQLIDARDLARWMLTSMEAGVNGTFDACGPAEQADSAALVDAPLSLGSFLMTLQSISAQPSVLRFVDPARLTALGADPSRFPFCETGAEGAYQRRLQRAIDTGLVTRPLEATARDVLEWARLTPPIQPTSSLLAQAPSREEEARWLEALG